LVFVCVLFMVMSPEAPTYGELTSQTLFADARLQVRGQSELGA